MLMNEKALRARIDAVYGKMRQRAKSVLWKTGKRAGKVRRQGIDGLPFTRQQLWDYAVAAIGPTGITRCPYCEAIGRPAFLIDLTNLVFDHIVPLTHGGDWSLRNLKVCCEDCNRCKGNLTLEFFIAVMSEVEKWHDPRDRSSFHACLRTHGISQRLRGFHGKPPNEVTTPLVIPTTAELALTDNW